jgi:hypothetical protein
MTRYLFIRTAAIILAFLPALVTGAATAPADRELTLTASHEQGHRYFVYPVEIQEARKVCFRQEREVRGITGDKVSYVAWWNANVGTPAQLDWSAAYQACKDNHELPGGKWNWDAMIEVQR